MRTTFRDSVTLITGAASGLGRALAQAAARRGARVVLADRQLAEAQEVAQHIREHGGTARAVELDVRDPVAFEAVVRDIVETWGRIDLFFNNAGIAIAGEVAQYHQRDWDDVLDVNVRGVIHGIQSVYPQMVAQQSGHIINTASVAGLTPMPGGASYSMSKHAVIGLSKALRGEAKSYGVRVSMLCPGVIRTAILNGGAFGRIEHLRVGPETRLSLLEKFRPMDPDEFAERALDQVAVNARVIIVPRWWRALWWLERLAPPLSEEVWRAMFARGRKLAGTP